ncbi:MAG: FtsX-like permease family protein, partial [Bacteroidota bacterium]
QIIGQFLAETVLILSLSIILGLFFAILFIVPQFRSLFSFYDFGFQDLNGLNLIIALILILFGMSAIAGIYPALYNSKQRPVALVKGFVKLKGNNWFTRSLVSLQFAVSIIFLIAGIFFVKNIGFQEQIDFGYNKENLMVLSVDGEQTYEVMKNRIEQMPKVSAVGGTYSHVGLNSYGGQVELRENTYQVGLLGIGANYLPTMNFEMIQGKGFKPIAASVIEGPDLIVNQAFIEKTELDNPLGETVQVHEFKGRIIGVVQNHLDGLSDPKSAKPFVYYQTGSKTFKYLAIRANAKHLASLQNDIIKIWKTEFPAKPFNIRRQDEVLLGPHRINSEIFGKVFIFLTVLGVLMSISGIYSMASQNIAKRKKEIGIRKILGANVGNIMILLNREFTWVLGLAAIVGALGGRFLTDTLLSFMVTHHIPVGLLPVIVCALFIFSTGIFTTSSSILKAAYTNPVDSLKSE